MNIDLFLLNVFVAKLFEFLSLTTLCGSSLDATKDCCNSFFRFLLLAGSFLSADDVYVEEHNAGTDSSLLGQLLV